MTDHNVTALHRYVDILRCGMHMYCTEYIQAYRWIYFYSLSITHIMRFAYRFANEMSSLHILRAPVLIDFQCMTALTIRSRKYLKHVPKGVQGVNHGADHADR